MNVCIVALGKIGLPLAVQIATKGHQVIGADVSRATVDMVNAGEVPFPGEAGLAEALRDVRHRGLLEATTDTTTAVRASEAVLIVVPLVVGDDLRPRFEALDAATRAIAAGLQPGTLVSYETTLPVGTTRQRFAPALVQGSGLAVGRDLFLVFSPERVSSGRIFADLRRYPKLVGGVDDASTARGIEFYESILDFDERPDLARPNGVWAMDSAEASEFAKLAETTYRDVNIGLANEFARYADTIGVDVYDVIAASNSQPFSHIHQPGIAVGGHCIPVYPRFYLTNDPAATLPAAARTLTSDMPRWSVEKLQAKIGGLDGRRVTVLGIAYRGGVKEHAFSGVFPVVAELRARGADVAVHDPLYDDAEIAAFGFSPYQLGNPCDAVLVQTDHAEYRSLDASQFPGAQAVMDGRRILDVSRWKPVPVLYIGAPTA